MDKEDAEPTPNREDFYQEVFRLSAVSLWLQDISRLREMLLDWRAGGIDDIVDYLKDNPDEFRKAVHAISVVDVNDATMKMYEEVDKSELVGPLDRALDLEEPFVVRDLLDDISSIVEGRAYRERESAAILPSGRRIDVQLSIYVPPISSSFPYMLVNVVDVTELNRLRREFAEEHRHYRSIFTNAPVGIFQSSAEGRLLDANQAFASSVGYDTPEELIEAVNAVGIQSLYANPLHRQMVASSMHPGRGWRQITGLFRRKDGSVGHGRMMLRRLPHDESARPVLEGFVEDITSSVETEQTLAWERSLYQAFMDNSFDRIYFKDRAGKFTLVNRAAAESLGARSADEVVGKTIEDFFDPEFAEAARSDEEHILQSGEPLLNKEERRLGADGSIRWLKTSKMPLRDGSGTIVGTIGITRDNTDEKQLHLQEIRIQRLESLGQLSSGIAHRFNNINAGIVAYLEAALRNLGRPARARADIRMALEAVNRAAEITSRLQILTRAARSEGERLDLIEVLSEVIEDFRKQTTEESIQVRAHWQGPFEVRGSRRSMQFVFHSLFSNAVHSLLGRSPRIIDVRVREDEESPFIEISDTGCGLSEEDSAKVFTPFFTTKGEWADPGSPQETVKGTGLSLAVSQSLMAEQGGRLELKSVEGRGTSVRVRFVPSTLLED